jgi:hypothetical protein
VKRWLSVEDLVTRALNAAAAGRLAAAGGRLWVESADGAGTTVVASIPYALTAVPIEAAPTTPEATAAATSPSAAGSLPLDQR